MNFRTICIAIIVALIAVLAAFNWTALSAPAAVSLGVTEIQAPLGVLMLALTILLSVFAARNIRRWRSMRRSTPSWPTGSANYSRRLH